MDIDSIRLLATAGVVALGTAGPAIAIGMIGGSASKIQTAMILAIAFAEAVAIYALVIALIIKFVA